MKRKIKQNSLHPAHQSGSIFFYILLGVVLFGALAFTMTRGMRSQSTDALSQRELELAASEMIERAQIIGRAVSKLRSNQISETDFCFSHERNAEKTEEIYTRVSGCAQAQNKIYNEQGGALTYANLPKKWLQPDRAENPGFGEWIFSASNSVIGFGTGDMSQPGSADLIAYVNFLKEPLCAAMNKALGISGIPDNKESFKPDTPYIGRFEVDGKIEAIDLSGKNAGCFRNNSGGESYVFYTVLLERD